MIEKPERTHLEMAFLRAVNPVPYAAVVSRVVDGDTVDVTVPAWSNTPFGAVSVRVFGIDTPESRKPPGKCITETVRGKAAHVYASTLLKPGDPVTVMYRGHDKYFRIDADLVLPNGTDFGSAMMTAGYAAAYSGGAKQSWCHRGAYPALIDVQRGKQGR